MKLSYRTRFFLLFLTFSLTILTITFFARVITINKEITKSHIRDAKRDITTSINNLSTFITLMKGVVHLVVPDNKIDPFIKGSKRVLTYMFLTKLAETQNPIFSISYIKQDGTRLIEIKRIGNKKLIYTKINTPIKNKEEINSIKKVLSLKKKDVYVSQIFPYRIWDRVLNEYRFLPAIRMGVSVLAEDGTKNVIFIDISLIWWFKHLEKSPIVDTYIIDSSGYFVLHPVGKYRWTKERNINYTVYNEFPNTAKKIINVGDLASPGAPLFSLETHGKFQVEFYVPEKHIDKVHLNQQLTITIPSMDNIRVKGVVVRIDPAAD